jgi:hypothetical protein
MTSLHQPLNQENAHEQRESAVQRLDLRWSSSSSSSSRVAVDRAPSQPMRRRPMSGGPSSDSVKESRTDPCVADAPPRRRENESERLQQSDDSRSASASGVTTDRPPFQPLTCPGSAPVGRLQQSDSRWSSGSAATSFAGTAFQALAPLRTLAGPSSAEMTTHDALITTIRALCILNLLGKRHKRQSLVASGSETGDKLDTYRSDTSTLQRTSLRRSSAVF